MSICNIYICYSLLRIYSLCVPKKNIVILVILLLANIKVHWLLCYHILNLTLGFLIKSNKLQTSTIYLNFKIREL